MEKCWRIRVLRALFFCLIAFCTESFPIGADKCSVTADEVKGIVLENKYLKMTVDFRSGGRATEVVYKTRGVDLTWFGPHYGKPAGGLFGDRITTQGFPGDYLSKLYKYKVLEDTPGKVRVKFFADGVSGKASNLEIAKIITVYSDRSYVDVEHIMTYKTGMLDPVDAIDTGFWTQNVLRIRDIKTDKAFTNTFFVPAEKGVLPINYVPGKTAAAEGTKDGYINNSSLGWNGVIGGDAEKSGAVFSLEYERLDKLYYYMSADFPTVEWSYFPVSLKDTESFTTRTRLMPFYGLNEITGAGDGLVGEIAFEKESYALPENIGFTSSLFSVADRPDVSLETGYRRLPGEKETVILEKTVNLHTDSLLKESFNFKTTAAGTYVITVRVKDSGGSVVAKIEKPLVVGSPSAEYVLKPTRERLRPAVKESKERTAMTGPESPHVKWANPYYKGPVRVLFIVPMKLARQVVELQQRLDMEYDYVYVRGNVFPEPGSTPLIIDRPGEENREKEVDRLRRYLTDNRYDVMVLTSLSDSSYVGSQPPINLPEDIEELVIRRVKEGMGLIYYNAGPTSESWQKVLPLIVESGGAMPPMPGSDSLYESRGIRIGEIADKVKLKPHYVTSAVPSISFSPPVPFWTAVKITGEAVANYEDTPVMAVGTFGKGRIVSFSVGSDFLEFKDFRKFPPLRNDEYLEYPYYEYNYLLLSKSLLWAGNREPETRIAKASVSPAKIQVRDDISLEVVVANSSSESLALVLLTTVYDKFYKKVVDRQTEIKVNASGSKSVSIPLGRLPGRGRYTADVVVKDGKNRVVDSGARDFEVESGTVIEKVELDKKLHGAGGRINGFMLVNNNAAKSYGVELTLNIVDTHNRIIKRQAQKAELVQGENKIPFILEGILTSSHVLDIECGLMDKGGFLLDKRIAYVYLKQPWDTSEMLTRACSLSPSLPSSRVGRTLIRALKDYGVEASGMEIRNYQPFVAIKSDFRRGDIVHLLGSYTGVMGDRHIPSREGSPVDWQKAQVDDVYNIAAPFNNPTYCIHHPDFRQGKERQVKSILENQEPFGYDVLSVADENVFQRWIYDKTTPKDDICFCRHTIKAFQEYMKKEYGSLDTLNKSWQKDFKKWEDVVPETARHARFQENIAPWLDFRIFLAKDYANVFMDAQKIAREVYPGIRFAANVHWEGPYTCFMPYYLFGKDKLAACSFYPRTFDQVRSHAFEPRLRQLYVGYDAWGHTREWSDYYVWKNLGYGSGLTGIYNGLDFVYWGSVITPSYGPGSLSKWTEDYYRYMKQAGMAKIILTAEQKKPEVAVLDSYPSQFAYYLEPHLFDEKGYYKKNTYSMWNEYKKYWSSYGALCEDLGLGWRLISNEELKEGQLGGFKAVILPRTTCISDSTLEKLREFVKNGGLVITGYRLAAYDEHGSPQMSHLLEKMFGVKREKPEWDESPGTLSIDGKDTFKFKEMVQGLEREKDISVAGSAAATGRYTDGTPAVIVNKIGRGYAVYLNFTITNYSSGMGNIRNLFGALFTLAEMKSNPVLEDAAGEKVPGVFMNKFHRGNLQYVFLLGNPASGEAYLHPDKRYHVYEIPGNKYLGLTEKIPVSPVKTRGTLYALLPYEVKDVSLALQKNTVTAGEDLTMVIAVSSAEGQTAGDHVVRIEVYTPEGEECEYWTENAVTEKGAYVKKLATALNEKTGDWRVKVTDTVSGRYAEKTFEVKEKGNE